MPGTTGAAKGAQDAPNGFPHVHHIRIGQSEVRGQRRANPSGAERGHGDAERPQFEAEGVEQTVDAGLAGEVAGHVRQAAIRGHAGQGGQVAAAALTHAGQDGVDGIGDADEVDLDLGREVLAAEALGRRLDTDAGAGHHQVRGAELRFELRHGGAHGRQLGDIDDGTGYGFAFQLRGEAVEKLRLAIEGGDAGALGGQRDGELTADAAGGPRDERDAVLERFHTASVVGLPSSLLQGGGRFCKRQ